MKIKKGDNVVVIAGKEKGKSGTVLEAMPKTDQVIVEGLNMITRHTKNKRTRGSKGQVIEKSAPIHVSNVAFLEGKKAVRIGYKVEGEGKDAKKVRISKQSGKTL